LISQIFLNSTPIEVDDFSHSTIPDKKSHDLLRVIAVDFKVSSKDYHDITALLYKNDFNIIIPGKNIEFRGHILNYSTSITDLYQEDQVGDFHLELIETSH